MTEKETRGILMMIEAVYPNFRIEDDKVETTVSAWHWSLEEYPVESVKTALQMYIKTNTTGFPPSVSQLISGIYKPQERKHPTEGYAWEMVKKAIQDGNYHAEERFNELPEIVQKAVGSANMIREWAATDSDHVNTVIMSNFQRNYKTVVMREVEDAKISPFMSEMIEAMEQIKQIEG